MHSNRCPVSAIKRIQPRTVQQCLLEHLYRPYSFTTLRKGPVFTIFSCYHASDSSLVDVNQQKWPLSAVGITGIQLMKVTHKLAWTEKTRWNRSPTGLKQYPPSAPPCEDLVFVFTKAIDCEPLERQRHTRIHVDKHKLLAVEMPCRNTRKKEHLPEWKRPVKPIK